MSISPSRMVVDDDEELAYLFMKSLKGSGFNSVSFTDPLLAIKHFKQNPEMYNLVLTDLRVPEMDSLQLAKKNNNPDVKIPLFVTAFYTNENFNSDGLRESPTSYAIQNLLKTTQLQNCVNNLLCYNTTS